jgi:hypothetical protein
MSLLSTDLVHEKNLFTLINKVVRRAIWTPILLLDGGQNEWSEIRMTPSILHQLKIDLAVRHLSTTFFKATTGQIWTSILYRLCNWISAKPVPWPSFHLRRFSSHKPLQRIQVAADETLATSGTSTLDTTTRKTVLMDLKGRNKRQISLAG